MTVYRCWMALLKRWFDILSSTYTVQSLPLMWWYLETGSKEITGLIWSHRLQIWLDRIRALVYRDTRKSYSVSMCTHTHMCDGEGSHLKARIGVLTGTELTEILILASSSQNCEKTIYTVKFT